MFEVPVCAKKPAKKRRRSRKERRLAAAWGLSGFTPTFEPLEVRAMLSLSAGSLDTTFNHTGTLTPGFTAQATAVAYNPISHDILVAGTYNNGGTNEMALAAFTATGALDTAFNGTGFKTIAIGSASQANAIAVDPNGNIFVAGSALEGTNTDFAVAEISSTGSLVGAFNSGGTAVGPQGTASAIALQPLTAGGPLSGGYNVVLAGLNATSNSGVAIFNSSGSLTASKFTSGAGNTELAARGVAIDPATNNILVVGQKASNFTAELDVFTANASSVAIDQISALGAGSLATSITPYGSNFLIAGTASSDFVLAEINSSGALVSGFGTGGSGETKTAFTGDSVANDLAVQANGKIVLAGEELDTSGNEFFAVARYNSNGLLDPNFGTGGTTTTDFSGDATADSVAAGVAIEGDGKIVVAGYTDAEGSDDFAVARYVANNAPTASGSATFSAIDQRQTNSSGNTVASLISQLGVSDVDGDALALAVTNVDDSNGTWQYSTDGGTTWSNIPAVSDTNALYLTNSASNLIRFAPTGLFFSDGTMAHPDPTITVRAADQSQGYADGSLIDAYSSSDSAADSGPAGQNLNSFSDQTYSASIRVMQLNSVVYVNSTWAGSSQGETVTDSEGHTHTFGIDAFATIQNGVDFVATGGTVNLDGGTSGSPLTYTEDVTISQSLTLTAYGMATPTVTAPATATDAAIISVDAPNVTVEGLDITVDQPYAAAGIAAVSAASGPNVFDGLQVLDNTIVSTGSGGFLNTPFGSTYSIGIAALANGGDIAPSVTIAGNTILPTVNDPAVLRRAIWVNEAQGTIGGSIAADGNIVAGSYEDVLDAFARGATTLENNTFDGVGVTITEPNANAPTTIEGNKFQPQFNFVDDAGLEIKHNYNSTSPVTIEDNTFSVVSSSIGLLSAASIDVGVSDNIFGPAAGATNTVDIDVDTMIPSGSQPSPSTLFPNSISITGNTFNAAPGSGATAIQIANHDAGAISPDFGSITIGGSGAGQANTFSENLEDFIVEAPPSSSVSFSGDVYSGSEVHAGNVPVNIDASQNDFGVTSGDTLGTYTLADYYEIEDQIVDGIDYSGAGLVTINPGNLYVTPNSFLSPATDDTGAIQRAVNLASSGNTINIESGTYIGNVDIATPGLQILGPNAGIAGSSNSRVTEAIVEPGLNSSYDTSSIFDVEADNVTISGLTIQGSIASPSGGQSAGFSLSTGTTTYAAAGISNAGNVINAFSNGDRSSVSDISGLTVEDNIVKDFKWVGIYGDTNSNGDTPSSGNLITDNLISDVPQPAAPLSAPGDDPAYAGEGVEIYDNFYANITGNVMNDVGTGIQTGNNYEPPSANFVDNITGNNITAYFRGLYYNLSYMEGTVGGFNVSSNTITFDTDQPTFQLSTYNVGLLIQSLANDTTSTISDNNISGFLYGIEIWNDNANSTLVVQGGTLTGNTYGVWATNNDTRFGLGGTTSAILDDVTIADSTTAGVLVYAPSGAGATSVSLTVQDGTTITGSETGILVQGALASATITGDSITDTGIGIDFTQGASGSLGSTDFSGATPNSTDLFIDATAGTFTDNGSNTFAASSDYIVDASTQYIDATNDTFGNVTTSDNTLADLFGVEDKILDGLDFAESTPGTPAAGMVRLRADEVFLAASSEASAAGSIQRAVDLADGGPETAGDDTIHVQAGSFVGGFFVDQEVSLLGAQTGVAGADRYSGSSVTDLANETVITSPANDPVSYFDGGNNFLVRITASGVEFDGFVVDGSAGGGDGIGNVDSSGNLIAVSDVTVTNDIVENVAGEGIYMDLGNNATPTTGSEIENNVVANAGYDGIGIFDNFYAAVEDNSVYMAANDPFAGIDIQDYYNYTGSLEISGNTISVGANDAGMFVNLIYGPSDTINLDSNTINAAAGVTTSDDSWGIAIFSIQVSSTVSMSGNQIGTAVGSGALERGVYVWNAPTSQTISITGGAIDADVGVEVSNYDSYYLAAGGPTSVDISGVAITATTDGVFVSGDTSGAYAASATVGNGTMISGGAGTGILASGADASVSVSDTTITMTTGVGLTVDGGTLNPGDPVSIVGGTTGLVISGSTAVLTGNTLSDMSFTGQTGNYIEIDSALGGTATAPTTIDATGVTFDGFLVGTGDPTTDLATYYGIENKISDYLDQPTSAYVRLLTGYDFVTQQSENTTQGAIQRGVYAAVSGDTVDVQAGTYKDNIVVVTPVTIDGAGQGSTTIYSAVVNPLGDGLGSIDGANIILVQANNVTIENLTVDGTDLSDSNVATSDGVEVAAGTGIAVNYKAAPGIFNNLNVNHVTVQNIYLRGIEATSGGTFDFEYDTVTNVEGDPNESVAMFNDFGSGIMAHNMVSYAYDALSANWSAGTSFIDNTITNSDSGIHTDNSGESGSTDYITGNNVSLGSAGGGAYGVWVFVPYSTVVVSGNTISGVDVGLGAFGGMGGTAEFSDNSVSVNAGGIAAWVSTDTFGYGEMNVSASFDGDSLSGGAYGIEITQLPGATATATISGNVSISSNTTNGVGVLVSGSDASVTFSGSMGSPSATITGNSVGIEVDGGSATIAWAAINSNTTGIEFTDGGGGSLANNNFDGTNNGTDLYIASNAGTVTDNGGNQFAGTTFIDNESSQAINATNDTFDVGPSNSQVGGNSLTNGEAYAIEDRIIDAIDVEGLGLVRIVDNNVYVTPNSFYATDGTTTPSIQRAVDAASAGDTVNIENGTYVGQVIVTKNLTLAGESQSGVVVQADANLNVAFTTSNDKYPVIGAIGAVVTIQGLTVDGDAQGNAYGDGFLGIAYYNAGGTIENVTVEDVENDPFNGVQDGVGIYADNEDGMARSLTISGDTIFNYQKNGMALFGTDLSLSVTNNIVTGAGATTQIAQNGIEVGEGATGTISGNTVSGNEYSGVGSGADQFTDTQSTGLLLFDTSGLVVENNIIDGNDIGIYNNTDGALISDNTLGSTVANRYVGIMEDQGSSTISGNSINGGDLGIDVVTFDGETGEASAAIVEGNTVTNAGVGLEAIMQSSGDPTVDVLAQNNDLVGNGEGVVISGGAIVDLGYDVGTHSPPASSNFTGLGTSIGHNTLTGYTGVGGNWAIDDQNAVGESNVLAEDNDFGPWSANDPSVIGNVINQPNTIVYYLPALDELAAPATVYVNAAWAGSALGSDPGSLGMGNSYGYNEFSDIQTAIDAVANGGTVMIANGTYDPSNILINHAVTIEGASEAGTIITPSLTDSHDDSSFGGTASNGFIIAASNVTIEDLTLDGGAGQNFRDGIITNSQNDLQTYNNITVQDVTVENAYRKGIAIYNETGTATGIVIKNDTLENIGTEINSYEGTAAIAVFGSDATIEDNTISSSAGGILGNTFDSSAELLTVSGNMIESPSTTMANGALGIDLAALAAGSTVSGNTIDLTGGTGNDIGIVVSFDHGAVTVSDNGITTVGGDDGILLYQDSTAVAVSGNTITGTTDTGAGILVTAQGSDTGRFGDVPGDVEATITGNTIGGFTDGIVVTSDDVAGDTASANIGDGTMVGQNSISGASEGIVFSGALVSGDINDNTISDSVLAGIQDLGANATISNNLITGGGDGIDADTLDSGYPVLTISGNTISGGSGHGMDLHDLGDGSIIGGATALDGNSVTIGDGGTGILAGFAQGSLTIENNSITASGDGAIGIDAVATAGALTISDNSVSGTSVSIDVNQPQGAATISGNTVTNTGDGDGIVVFNDTIAADVSGNMLTATSSAADMSGDAAGILITSGGSTTLADITGNTISGYATGIQLDSTFGAVSASIGGSVPDANTISGATTGILLAGGASTATIDDNTFTGNSTDLVIGAGSAVTSLTDNAFSGTQFIDDLGTGNIDATSDTFNVGPSNAAVAGNSLTLAEAFAVEDQITDAIDDGSLGFVRIQDMHVFVTPNSFYPTGGTTAPSIQRGINVASMGDTVFVEAGTYTGDLTIDTSITLSGAQAGVNPGTGGWGAVPVSTIFGAGANAPIAIFSDNVTIDGFAIESPVTGSGADNGGIYIPDSSDVTIEDNELQGNTAGVAIGDASGSITDNLIQNNNAPGAGAGNGIEFFTGSTGGWSIAGNSFTGNDNADVLIAGGATVSNVSITGNDFFNSASDPLFALSASSLQFEGNTVTDSAFAAVVLDGGDSSVQVVGNTISGTTGDAIYIGNDYAVGPNSSISVTNNFITDSSVDGVFVASDGIAADDTISINTNSISGNMTAGLDNESAFAIDATGNWWGSAAGPDSPLNTYAPNNPAGDAIIDPGTTIAPWLTSGAFDATRLPGFYPTSTLDATPPSLTGQTNQNAVEGNSQTFNLGSFIDSYAAPAGDTIVVNWGDGSFSSPIILAGNGSNPVAIGSLAHTYAEFGSYNVTITVTDESGLQNDTSSPSFSVSVADAPLTIDTLTPPTATEGAPFSNVTVATFTDDAGSFSNPSDLSATIYWGDGSHVTVTSTPSANGQLVETGTGQYEVQGSHTYAEFLNGATFEVVVNDVGGSTASQSTTIHVADAALTINTLTPPVATQGVPFSNVTVATFTDAAGSFSDPTDLSATIHWGDGQSVTVTSTPSANGQLVETGAGQYEVQGGHTYSEFFSGGTFQVTVNDVGGSTDSQSTSISVAQAASVPLTGNATATEGTSYTLTLGTPTVAGGYQIGTYVINWGDDFGESFVSAPADNAAAGGQSYTYFAEHPFSGPISVSIFSTDDTLIGVDNFSLTVTPATIHLLATNSGPVDEGQGVNVSGFGVIDPSYQNQSDATFTFKYTTTTGFSQTDVGGLGVSHDTTLIPSSYIASFGTYAVTVSVTDGQIGSLQGSGSTSTTVTVNDAPITAVGVNINPEQGVAFSNTQIATLTDDAGSESIPGDLSATINWGDGTPTTAATLVEVGTSGVYTVEGSHTYANTGSDTISVSYSDVGGSSTTSTSTATVSPPTFHVVQFDPTSTGFDVQLSAAPNFSTLNLYEGNGDALGAPDVTVVGQHTGTIQGSLVWNAATDTASFVTTDSVLAPDTYTVTLVSGANAWNEGDNGDLLQGSDNVVGDNYVATFTVSSSTGPVLNLPSFARGPGQNVDVSDSPGDTGTADSPNLPITITNTSANVLSVDFELDYNTSYLNVTNVLNGSNLPNGWHATFNISTPGKVLVSVSGSTALPVGQITLVDLVANVPDSAANDYGASALLSLTNVEFNGGELSGTVGRALEKVAYFGDAAGFGALSGLDASLVAQNVVQLSNGFSAYPLTDPRIIANVTGTGSLSGLDASYISQFVVEDSVPQIPAIPDVGPLTDAGADPTVTIASNVQAADGQMVNVPITIDQVYVDGHGLESVDLAITYDPTVLSLTDSGVTLGSYLASLNGNSSWSITSNVMTSGGNQTGEVLIDMFSATALNNSTPTPLTLLNLDFSVLADAAAGSTPVNIDTSTFTNRQLNGGQLTMTPVNGNVVVQPALAVVGSTPSVVFAGSMTDVPFNQFTLNFNESLNPTEANSAATYQLFDETSDVSYAVTPSYTANSTSVLLSVNAGNLPVGTYQLTIPEADLQSALGSDMTGDYTTTFEIVDPLTVLNTNDSGVGSLREVISNADALGGPSQTITFAIPAGPQTIDLLSALPASTVAIVAQLDSTQNVTIESPSSSVMDSFSAMTKTGDGTLTLAGANNLTGNVEVDGGSLAFDDSSMPTLAPSISAITEDSGALQLAGSVSDLSSNVNITNNSGASDGLLVSGTNQVVGNISGSGNTVLGSDADLTASSIIQSGLTIGAGATFVIGPSSGGGPDVFETNAIASPIVASSAPAVASLGGTDVSVSVTSSALVEPVTGLASPASTSSQPTVSQVATPAATDASLTGTVAPLPGPSQLGGASAASHAGIASLDLDFAALVAGTGDAPSIAAPSSGAVQTPDGSNSSPASGSWTDSIVASPMSSDVAGQEMSHSRIATDGVGRHDAIDAILADGDDILGGVDDSLMDLLTTNRQL